MNSAAARSKSFAVGGRLAGGRNHGEQGSCPDAHAADWIGEEAGTEMIQFFEQCGSSCAIIIRNITGLKESISLAWMDMISKPMTAVERGIA
jgi:hypothetical protein